MTDMIESTTGWISRALHPELNDNSDVGYMLWIEETELRMNPKGEAMYWHSPDGMAKRLFCPKRVWEWINPELTLNPGEARLATRTQFHDIHVMWKWADDIVRIE
jgi:hypothetical protein